MRHLVNGRIVEVPTKPGAPVGSDAIRKAAGIAPDRPLILQLPEGHNRIINPSEDLSLPPNQFFIDAPVHIRSWIELDRNGHGAKPEEVHGLVELVSPPPYLELYGRSAPPNRNWMVYGNQILSTTKKSPPSEDNV